MHVSLNIRNKKQKILYFLRRSKNYFYNLDFNPSNLIHISTYTRLVTRIKYDISLTHIFNLILYHYDTVIRMTCILPVYLSHLCNINNIIKN